MRFKFHRLGIENSKGHQIVTFHTCKTENTKCIKCHQHTFGKQHWIPHDLSDELSHDAQIYSNTNRPKHHHGDHGWSTVLNVQESKRFLKQKDTNTFQITVSLFGYNTLKSLKNVFLHHLHIWERQIGKKPTSICAVVFRGGVVDMFMPTE